MVEPRKFTATEWHDLARGQRILANIAEEDRKKNPTSSMERHFKAVHKMHLEMAELCEYWAKHPERY